MTLSARVRELLLSDIEPGVAYRLCLEEIARDGTAADYGLTETVAYGTEVRYAIEVLTNGPQASPWNFGDLRGDAETRLWSYLDPLKDLRVAFVGSGPYPVTALLVSRRYPGAEITCIENNIGAYLLGKAVLERSGVRARCEFADAADVNYEPFNAVIVAAMVGSKLELVQKIVKESEALVILRGTVNFQHPRLIQSDSGFSDDGAIASAPGEADSR